MALSRSHFAHLTPVPICPYRTCWGKHVTYKPSSGEKRRLIKCALRGEERLMATFAAHVDVQYISTYISINLGPSLFTWTGVGLFWRTSAGNGVYMVSHNRKVCFSAQLFLWDRSKKFSRSISVCKIIINTDFYNGQLLNLFILSPYTGIFSSVSLVLRDFLLSCTTDSQRHRTQL